MKTTVLEKILKITAREREYIDHILEFGELNPRDYSIQEGIARSLVYQDLARMARAGFLEAKYLKKPENWGTMSNGQRESFYKTHNIGRDSRSGWVYYVMDVDGVLLKLQDVRTDLNRLYLDIKVYQNEFKGVDQD